MKTSKLPRTDSIQELARFWEKHDLTNFQDELEEVTEPVFVGGDSIRLHRAAHSSTGGMPCRSGNPAALNNRSKNPSTS